MESPEEGENRPEAMRAPRAGVKLMFIIVASLALVAVYANVQRVRRDKIEKVTITPATTATPPAR